MILSGKKIKKEIKKSNIKIKPFKLNQLNTSSYNCRLGNYLKVYDEKCLDPKKRLKTKTIKIPEEGIVLNPNKIYLGFTKELIGSDKYVPILTGRSSIARLGLFIHITSELIDLGFYGNLTLQLHATKPIKVYKGMEICQIMFFETSKQIKLYDGKYQNAIGAKETESWRDFKSEK